MIASSNKVPPQSVSECLGCDCQLQVHKFTEDANQHKLISNFIDCRMKKLYYSKFKKERKYSLKIRAKTYQYHSLYSQRIIHEYLFFLKLTAKTYTLVLTFYKQFLRLYGNYIQESWTTDSKVLRNAIPRILLTKKIPPRFLYKTLISNSRNEYSRSSELFNQVQVGFFFFFFLNR